MDPTQLQPSDLQGAASPAAPIAGFDPQAGGFQAVYRETLEAPPARRGVDLGSDLRATAQSFMDLERYMGAERLRMYQALVPDLTLGAQAGAQPGTLVAGRGDWSQGASAGGATGPGPASDVAYGGALARDSDRVSLGVRPLFSDAPASVPKGLMAPLMQNAFAVPDGTDPNQIDFASQIERLDNASMTLMERMANVQRALPEGASLEDNMRQFGEMTSLSQQFSAVTTSKAVVAQIYVGVYEEVRNKALTALNLVQSAFNKVNQVFNQLKSGS